MIEPLQLITKESPRQIILEDFKIDLPISGYWGYNLESACVIDKNDPAVSKGMPFDGIGIEYIFVEKRIYEEMIILGMTTRNTRALDGIGRRKSFLLKVIKLMTS